MSCDNTKYNINLTNWEQQLLMTRKRTWYIYENHNQLSWIFWNKKNSYRLKSFDLSMSIFSLFCKFDLSLPIWMSMKATKRFSKITGLILSACIAQSGNLRRLSMQPLSWFQSFFDICLNPNITEKLRKKSSSITSIRHFPLR